MLDPGAVTAQQRLKLQSCPACNCPVAGECPLHARAIVILYLAAYGKRGQAPCLLPAASVYVTAHPDIHHHTQRQKHK